MVLYSISDFKCLLLWQLSMSEKRLWIVTMAIVIEFGLKGIIWSERR
nr:MAG TPA: hypothetical protein [Caudoviricetes sp.]